ncbi:hypothetical protein [Mycobacteroides abscessus]|uniref:hypothetical protein n=1 Tax=Mycobacteroides abscessus TaxID=36809 RepID=UPI0009A9008C|nr:hypothetical protein [Mycobacteroides abscessus]SLH41979.1 Uncharacterised protein [Mycobacteroides abscessus subsp. massiliense]
MSELFDESPVDLDKLGQTEADHASAPRSRPRRQCPHCYTNRSSILLEQTKGSVDRALQALRHAHPEEYDEYLQKEQAAAYTATEQAWEQHMAKRCPRLR